MDFVWSGRVGVEPPPPHGKWGALPLSYVREWSEQVGFEPPPPIRKMGALPLSYARIKAPGERMKPQGLGYLIRASVLPSDLLPLVHTRAELVDFVKRYNRNGQLISAGWVYEVNIS